MGMDLEENGLRKGEGDHRIPNGDCARVSRSRIPALIRGGEKIRL
jgi:hypothetical protein